MTPHDSGQWDNATASERIADYKLAGLIDVDRFNDRAVDGLGPSRPPPVGAHRWQMHLTVARLAASTSADVGGVEFPQGTFYGRPGFWRRSFLVLGALTESPIAVTARARGVRRPTTDCPTERGCILPP